MKLVDILARELKEWVSDWPAMGQAKDGTLHREPFLGGHTSFSLTRASDYVQAIVTRAQWQEARDALSKPAESLALHSQSFGRVYRWHMAPVGATHYIGVVVGGSKVDIHSWWMREPGDNWYVWAEPSRQWALDTPSAGQKNLMKPIHESLQKKEGDGDRLPPVGTSCEVKNDISGGWDAVDEVLVHTTIGGVHTAVYKRNDRVFLAREGEIRIIRTPEQIAAEEREAEIAEIFRICGVRAGDGGREVAQKIFDAGYRKVNDGNQKA